MSSWVKREVGELVDAYEGNYAQLQKEAGHELHGVEKWASKAVSLGLTPWTYAFEHVVPPLFGSHQDEPDQSTSRDQSIGTTRKTEKPMPGQPKKVYKKVTFKKKKKFTQPRRKPTQKKGTRYAVKSAYQPAGKKFTRGGRRAQVYKVGKSNTRVDAPPTALGFVRSQTNGFEFSRGRRKGCLMMSGKQYLGKLLATSDGDNSWVVLDLQDKPNTDSGETGVNMVTQFMVMPQNSKYFGNPVFNMTQMFERYSMKTRLMFKTISGTSVPGAIKFAYYDDPIAFFTQTGKTGWSTAAVSLLPTYAGAPTAADMSSMQTIREGSTWKSFEGPWSYSGPRQEMQYVPAPTYANLMSPDVRSPIDMRQSIEGVWVIGSTGVSGPSNTFSALGEIWIDYQLELCDIMSAAPVTGIALRSTKSHVSSSEKLELTQQSEARLQKLEELLQALDLKNHDVKTTTDYRATFEAAASREEKFDPTATTTVVATPFITQLREGSKKLPKKKKVIEEDSE